MVTLYFVIAFIVSFIALNFLQSTGLSGDQIISMLPDDESRQYLYDNPNSYKYMMIISIILLGLLWPITLIYAYKHWDDINKFGNI